MSLTELEYKIKMLNRQPIDRARLIRDTLKEKGWSLREFCRQINIPIGTGVDWVSMLELPLKWQEQLSKRRIFYSDGLRLKRLHFTEKQLDELLKVIEEKGYGEFKGKLIELEKQARAPKQKHMKPVRQDALRRYFGMIAIIWDKTDPSDSKDYLQLEKTARDMKQSLAETAKSILHQYFTEDAKTSN